MTNVLKDVFGDTKRISILEELVERWGEFLTISELARISNTSKKTVYNHINELEKIRILEIKEGKARKYKLNEDDERAIALAILQGAEYIRKGQLSLEGMKSEEIELEGDVHAIETLTTLSSSKSGLTV
ncbi:MAG: winged helix-turn-helix domain-containing protein [Methanobacterium sp.]|jgi:transcriptional antiterminator|nr:winged helix-turn-helix domain-containing protein [Methanobacterium sp.]